MKPIVQSLWIGGSLSLVEQLCVSSFLATGHEFRLYVYDEVKNIPTGTVVCDANTIIDRKNIFTDRKGSYAGFADWFRFELLKKTGEFYVDMDVVALKRFDFKKTVIFGAENADIINTAVMRFPENHFLVDHMIDRCRNPNKVYEYDSRKVSRRKRVRRLLGKNSLSVTKWGECAGPTGFSAAIRHFGLEQHATPFFFFYPVNDACWSSFYDTSFADNYSFFDGSYAVHLWNERSRRVAGFDKNGTFHESSYIEHLKRKYLNG